MLSFMTSLHRKELLLSGSEESVVVQSQVCVRVCVRYVWYGGGGPYKKSEKGMEKRGKK